MAAPRTRWVVLILTGLCCGLAWSASWPPPQPGRGWYVAQNSPGASDDNDGTRARPFRTLGRAVQAVAPGDTVWIAGGVYREGVRVEKSGTGFDRMLSFRALPGETVIISGGQVLTTWTRVAGDPRPLYETPWPRADVYPSMIAVDDEPLRPYSIPPQTQELRPPNAYCQYFLGFGLGREQMTPGSFWFDEARKQLQVWLPRGDDPADHRLEAGMGFPWLSCGNYILVEGLKFRYSPLVVPLGGVTFVMCGPGGGSAPADGCIVRDCEVSLGAFEGMVVRGGKRVTTLVENCWVHHNGNGCGSFEGQGDPDTDSWLHVRRCRITDNNLFNWNPAWHCGGKHFGNRVFFDECEFARQHNAPGVWFDIHNRDCIVNRCVAYDCDGFALYYEIGETGAFINNVVEGSRTCAAIGVMGSSRTLVANNAVWARERGIFVNGESRDHEPASRLTFHNTVVNNVVRGGKLDVLTLTPDHNTAGGNTSDYNLLWAVDPDTGQPNPKVFEGGYGRRDLTTWRQERNQDLATRVMDPLAAVISGRFLRRQASPTWAGGRRLGLAELRAIFAVRPMPEVAVEGGGASARDHRPASEAFLKKVAALLAVPPDQPMPVGPIPAPAR